MRITQDVYLVGSGQIRLSNKMDSHVYLVDGGEELALIDSGVGLETETILDNIKQEGFDPCRVRYLLLTHSHADHAGGCAEIRQQTGCRVVASEPEAMLLERGTEQEIGLDRAKRSGMYPSDYSFPHCKVDLVISDGGAVRVGRHEVRGIVVPGHSKGSLCLLMERVGCRMLFSSDVVFLNGTIGLGNWPGSSLEDYRRNIGKLRDLSIDALLPGHYLWTLRDGQEHLDKAIQNLDSAWVPPAWQHQHPHC